MRSRYHPSRYESRGITICFVPTSLIYQKFRAPFSLINMVTLRWELFPTKSRHETYDLGIAYKIPNHQTDEKMKEIASFRRRHKQCLRDRISRKESLRTEEWENGSLVVKRARVTSLTKITKVAKYSGESEIVSYKLYFRSSEDAERLAKVVGFGSRPSSESGNWYFLMPTKIRDDSAEWKRYEYPLMEPANSRRRIEGE